MFAQKHFVLRSPCYSIQKSSTKTQLDTLSQDQDHPSLVLKHTLLKVVQMFPLNPFLQFPYHLHHPLLPLFPNYKLLPLTHHQVIITQLVRINPLKLPSTTYILIIGIHCQPKKFHSHIPTVIPLCHLHQKMVVQYREANLVLLPVQCAENPFRDNLF